MLTYECPHCRRGLRAPDDSAGRAMRCPHCGQVGTAPAGDTVSYQTATGQETTQAPPTAPLTPGQPTAANDRAARGAAAPPAGGLSERYELLGELGRGGMGIVYKARQRALGRLVAVKMVLAGEYAGPHELARFKAEAEAAARLQHPNIVQVYEVGEADGRPFFSLEYCPGGSLARKLDGTPWPPRKAAELVQTLAVAMHAAHKAGVVHRDLKPANVLLAEDGTLKVTDFGLAKRLEDSAGATATGAVMGTPAYMAPEQAEGRAKAVGPAADVYALGVILYELLTGRPPFKGATLLETLDQVRSQEPVPPRRLQPATPRDLESICLKCLEKDWRQRYDSAAALADDLRAFGEGAPIRARPVGPMLRGVKWAKRRPALAALLIASAVAVLALVGVGVGLWYSGRLQETNDRLQVAYDDADHQRQQAEQLRTVAEDERVTAEEQRRRAETLKGEADQQRTRAEEQSRRARRFQYDADINLAHQAWNENDAPRLRDILERNRQTPEAGADLHGFEWHYLQHLSRDVRRTIPLRTEFGSNIAYSPDGRFLVWRDKSRLTFWDRAAGKEARVLQGQTGEVHRLAFRPDGRCLATSGEGGTITLWNLADGKPLRRLAGPRSGVFALAFAPDGRRLASRSDDPPVQLWDVDSGQLLRTLGESGNVWCVAFSPDGKRLATGGGKGIVKLWDVESGSVLSNFKSGNDTISHLAFSSDGRHLAVAQSSGEEIQLWDAAGERLLQILRGHTNRIMSIAFRPDGRVLASASGDRTIRLWDVESGKEISIRRGHSDYVLGAAFSRDGTELASVSRDKTVRLWDLTREAEALVLRGHTGYVESVAFRPDGKCLLSSAMGLPGTNLKFWDADSGQEVSSPLPIPRLPTAAAYRPDGKALLVASLGSTLQEFDLVHGKQGQTFRGHTQPIHRVVYSLDSKRLASSSSDKTIRVWDVQSGETLLTIRNPFRYCTAFSSDSRHFAFVAVDSRLRRPALFVWDLSTKQEAFQVPLPPENANVTDVAFSPDGRYLASCASWRTIRVWEADSGRPVMVLQGHGPSVSSLAFSPDGRRLATGEDQSIKVWDMATGQELLTLRGHTESVLAVAFSPDGRLLASGDRHGTVRLWGVGTPSDPSTAEVVLRQRRRTWHARQASDSEWAGQWFAVAVHLTHLLAEDSGNVDLYWRRAEAHAEGGAWDRADADLLRAIELKPENPWPHWARARVLLQRGDRDGYRKTCELLLDRFEKHESTSIRARVVQACVLAPDAVADPQRVVRLAETLIAENPKSPLNRQALGAALCRAGRFADAVKQLEEGIKDGGQVKDLSGSLFLALAHRRLGHAEEAERWAKRAARWAEESDRKLEWYERVELRLLQEEARPRS